MLQGVGATYAEFGELCSGCRQDAAAAAPNSAAGYRGKSAELNPLTQELNSTFPSLIRSFIPCFLQYIRVIMSWPGLSPVCLWGCREQWFTGSSVLQWPLKIIFFFLAKLESKEIAALILACLSARCSDLTGLWLINDVYQEANRQRSLASLT